MIFGDWTNHISALSTKYANAKPFEHVVIPNFFEDSVVEEITRTFPEPGRGWNHYDNPIEQKYSLNNFAGLEFTSNVFNELQSPRTIAMFSELTGIADLEADPYLHGAGLHAYPRGGKLDMHLDYSLHPIICRERRLNLIVYLNRDWRVDYGGHLQLWDSDLKKCTELITPNYNTAVLFRTSDISYHGIPAPITCPDGAYRKSLAIYYVSPPRPECSSRAKAQFFPRPSQPVDERLRRLYEIRAYRLITAEDLADWPTWRQEGAGFW